jgi:NAD(P)-dependent dehydrogenase (short-subunit alcohol dehydrogenase family)
MNKTTSIPTALVTGAGRRIGLFLVNTLLDQGYRVIAHYRQSHTRLARLQETGVALTLVQADLTTAAGLMKVCDTIPEGETLDMLINNASIFYRRDRGDITREDYLDFYHLHVVIPALMVQKLKSNLDLSAIGIVVNLLDARDVIFHGGFTPYALSRLTARELTRLQAKELGSAQRVYGLALERLLPDAPGNGKEDAESLKQEEDAHSSLAGLHTGLMSLLSRQLPTGEILTINS